MNQNSPRSPLDEGELLADDESKEFDDGYDENLMGDDEDRKKLAQMTEKEREQELFNRSERRETLKIRFEIERKLRSKAKKREQERKQSQQQVRAHKRLRASEIYSSDESSEESDEYTPDIRHTKSSSGLNSTNTSTKPATKMSTRNSTAAAASNLLLSSSESSSASADSSADSSGESASNSDDDDDEDDERHTKAHHDDQDDRQSVDDDFQMSLADLRSLQLKRDKIEKWVYAPFFRETAVGLFVKISVGVTGLMNGPQPMYKVAQVVEITKGSTVYPINEEGKYKTDKQCTVRIGRAERTYKMSYVSNRGFDEDDYNRWRDQLLEGQGHPSRETFLRKRRDLQRAFNYEYTDEDIAYEVTERSRFKDNPYNFALKKTELMGEKADAEASNDYERASQIQAIIDELENKARELEKTRSSSTFSAISFVNERNRQKNIVESERALKESKSVKTEDPFTRRKCAPTIVHNKNNNGDILNNSSSSALNDKSGANPLATAATPNQHQRTTNNATSNNYNSSTTTTTPSSLSTNNNSTNNKPMAERVKSVDDLFQAHASIDLELDIDI